MSNFEWIQSLINDPSFYEIKENWQSVPLFDYHKVDKKVKGLYALAHPEFGIVYIGKGNPLWNRLKSHFKATQGHEKAECWKQFFEHNHFNSGLIAYYYPLDCNDLAVSEQCREALERILQIKYKPLFDRLYPKGNHKLIEDLEEKIKTLFYAPA